MSNLINLQTLIEKITNGEIPVDFGNLFLDFKNPLKYLTDSLKKSVDDYSPIDLERVKKEWLKIFNIPSNKIEEIVRDVKFINNKDMSLTARIFQLNNLPFSVITILEKLKKE